MAIDEIPGPDEASVCLCPVTGVLETLANKYAMQVLCAIGSFDGARFSELESTIPDASTSTLSTRLDELEAEGLVARERYDEIPPRVEYTLTDDGRELCVRLLPVLAWAGEREGLVEAAELADLEGGIDLAGLVAELSELLDGD